MCLLLFYLNPNATINEYRLILINNRDEFYHRPTKPAEFWGAVGRSTIGGTDLTEGSVRGTWLAINPNGRFSCILNILQPNKQVDSSKKSRGYLTTSFVEGKASPATYLEEINGSDYNGFLLVTMDLKQTTGSFYTNKSSNPPSQITTGINVFGNSPPIKLWPKAAGAREVFERIVKEKTDTKKRNQLVFELEAMLKDRTYYQIDDQMLNQGDGMKIEHIKKLSSVFVEIQDFNYGTRSHTIILMDGAGNTEFIEHSMAEPIDILKGPEWITVSKTFKIE